jgi:predicted alpha/beta-fold hydrolase
MPIAMSATPSAVAKAAAVPLSLPSDPFQPPWLFRNGHIQTLAGTYLFGRASHRDPLSAVAAMQGEVLLDDGDRLVYHDDCPPEWKAGDRVVLLLHGLAGSHASPYMSRIAGVLFQRNVRTIRLNWRGCGTGLSLAKYPGHSGRSADLQATMDAICRRCPGSPISVVGFSMGGNVLLKLLGETGIERAAATKIDRAIAVSPPIDLSVTIKYIGIGWARIYDAYFAKTCLHNLRLRQRVRPDAIVPEGWFSRPPRNMREFDETFTAPVCGFASAADYYQRCSASRFLPGVGVPTLVIAAQDDPVVPFRPFQEASLSPLTVLSAPRNGGHLGFVTHTGPGWLDQQILNWMFSSN